MPIYTNAKPNTLIITMENLQIQVEVMEIGDHYFIY